MSVVGCYTLDLYCDTNGGDYGDGCIYRPALGGPGGQFVGHTEMECVRQARKRGWKFNRERTKCYCPACSKRGRNE